MSGTPPCGCAPTCRFRIADYARHDGEWQLELALPGVTRLEYQLEVVDRDGEPRASCDPGNPHRAPGAFGEKSVLLLPGLHPARLARRRGRARADPGADDTRARARRGGPRQRLEPGGRRARRAAAAARRARRAGVRPAGRADAVRRRRHRRRRAAAASGRAARPGRAQRVVLRLRALRGRARPATSCRRSARRSASTAPWSAWARASAGWRCCTRSAGIPGTFGALFLQSGSFFTPRFDAQESGFPRYQRIVRFVRATLREGVHADPVPVVLTCGTAEENVHNNRVMARTLSAQGYPASLHEVPDLHNYTAWRDAFDPAPDEPARAHVVSGAPHGAVVRRHRRERRRRRLRPLRPARRSRSPPSAAAPGSSSTTAWSTPSPACSTAAA